MPVISTFLLFITLAISALRCVMEAASISRRNTTPTVTKNRSHPTHGFILLFSLVLFIATFFIVFIFSLNPIYSLVHHVVQPIRHVALRHRHLRVGSRRERSAARVRNVSMAIPACLTPYFLLLKIGVPSRFYELRVKLFMAADTVVHDHL